MSEKVKLAWLGGLLHINRIFNVVATDGVSYEQPSLVFCTYNGYVAATPVVAQKG